MRVNEVSDKSIRSHGIKTQARRMESMEETSRIRREYIERDFKSRVNFSYHLVFIRSPLDHLERC